MFFISTAWTHRYLLCFLVVLQGIIGYGQVVQTNRTEIPLNRNEPMFEIAPSNAEGLYLYRHLRINEDYFLELIRLDTALEQQWSGMIHTDPKLELAGKRSTGSRLFFLFRHSEINHRDLVLYDIRLDDGKYEKHIIRNFIPFYPTDFQVSQHAAIVGGYYGNVPVVFYYSFADRRSRILPGLLNEAGELSQVQINEGGDFTVLISAERLTGNRTIFIKHYDEDGNLMYQMPLKTEGNKHLLFGRTVNYGQNIQLIAGTYGSRKSAYSKGIFLARIDEVGNQEVRYYNYGDLGNFFKYLKAKREQRIRDRIERRKILGKKIRFNYRFIVHEIVPHNNQFVLLGEAFYPKYVQVENRFSSSFFYNTTAPAGFYSHNGRIFDGYRYTHAVIIGFDEEGQLLWDNSFEINDVKTFTLEQFVKINTYEDRIALLYLFQNEIRSKIIERNNVVEGKTVEPIRTFKEGVTNRKGRSENTKGRMDYWYPGFFYAYGVQYIPVPGGEERRVFYVNKITYSDGDEGR